MGDKDVMIDSLAAQIRAEEDARALAELERLVNARKAAGLLVERQRSDETEAVYRQLVAKYGGNRHGRRRARAEARRKR